MSETLTETLKGVRSLGQSVFTNGGGSPFDNVRRSFDTAVRLAGIEDLRFHDLKHTFASRLVMAGVDLTTVKELLGHKSLQMTMRYAHLSPSHKMQAVRRLEDQPEIDMDTNMDTKPNSVSEAVA